MRIMFWLLHCISNLWLILLITLNWFQIGCGLIRSIECSFILQFHPFISSNVLFSDISSNQNRPLFSQNSACLRLVSKSSRALVRGGFTDTAECLDDIETSIGPVHVKGGIYCRPSDCHGLYHAVEEKEESGKFGRRDFHKWQSRVSMIFKKFIHVLQRYPKIPFPSNFTFILFRFRFNFIYNW